jgi:S1-C subfamily serine protease
VAILAGCGGKPAALPDSKATHGVALAHDCTEALDRVGRFEEVLTISAQEEGERRSLASALRMMRRFDRGVVDLSSSLDRLVVHDATLQARLRAYGAAARELGEGAESAVALIERGSSSPGAVPIDDDSPELTQVTALLRRAGAATKEAGASLRELCHDTPSPGHDASEWVTATKQDMRALTVVVSFKPPGTLGSSFERWARSATEKDGDLFKAAAAGGFGSGFVVVRQTEHGPGVFIVTNRHVVELADHVIVTRADGAAFRARIVYSDPHYDLAVLALEGDDPGFDHGFDLETSAVKDEQSVTATGFPGLANHPSYQVTKGYVSNDRFELDAGGFKLPYIQHTAPIDHGSSGGPLMSEGGKVLGVNTLKAFGRDGVAFAAPSLAVVKAVRHASTLDARLTSAAFRRQTFRDDCLDLVAELSRKEPSLWRLGQQVSTRMIADQGVASFNALSEDEDIGKLWKQDPVDALRFALVVRVRDAARSAGSPSPTETCANPNATDWDQILTTDRVRIPIRFGHETRELVMRWEQGRWKLAQMDLTAPVPAKKTKSVTTPRAKGAAASRHGGS